LKVDHPVNVPNIVVASPMLSAKMLGVRSEHLQAFYDDNGFPQFHSTTKDKTARKLVRSYAVFAGAKERDAHLLHNVGKDCKDGDYFYQWHAREMGLDTLKCAKYFTDEKLVKEGERVITKLMNKIIPGIRKQDSLRFKDWNTGIVTYVHKSEVTRHHWNKAVEKNARTRVNKELMDITKVFTTGLGMKVDMSLDPKDPDKWVPTYRQFDSEDDDMMAYRYPHFITGQIMDDLATATGFKQGYVDQATLVERTARAKNVAEAKGSDIDYPPFEKIRAAIYLLIGRVGLVHRKKWNGSGGSYEYLFGWLKYINREIEQARK
jgi:hypothetical protein